MLLFIQSVSMKGVTAFILGHVMVDNEQGHGRYYFCSTVYFILFFFVFRESSIKKPKPSPTALCPALKPSNSYGFI